MNITRRAWLNPANSADTGSSRVYARVMKDTDNAELSASLTIRDCSRSIDLNFDVGPWNEDTVAARRKKLQVLRRHLDVIEKGLDEYEKREKEYV